MIQPDDIKDSPMAATFSGYRQILDGCPVGIGVVNRFRIAWINRRGAALAGYLPGDLSGRHVRHLFESPADLRHAATALTDGMARFGTGRVTVPLTRRTGGVMTCRLRAAFLNPQDQESGVVVTVNDITDIRRRRIQDRQATKMEAVQLLAGGISHDINNLLMGIQGHLSVMRIALTDREKVVSHIQQIKSLVRNGAELTSRLLGFARGGRYQNQPLDMNSVVQAAVETVKPLWPNLEWDIQGVPELDPVRGDSAQLAQAVVEILENGARAMKGQGPLTITTRHIVVPPSHDYPFEVAPGPYIRLTIRDYGPGMSPSVQQKVFDPFFTTWDKSGSKGKGLGLSCVYGIVKNHQGFITVDSRPGHGAAFQVCLPADVSPTHRPAAPIP